MDTNHQQRNDLESDWLEARVATPSTLSDMWFTYLRGLGFTGSLDDMKHDFWEGPPPL